MIGRVRRTVANWGPFDLNCFGVEFGPTFHDTVRVWLFPKFSIIQPMEDDLAYLRLPCIILTVATLLEGVLFNKTQFFDSIWIAMFCMQVIPRTSG